MDFETFVKQSEKADRHFADLNLQALYYIKHDNWQAAHDIAENQNNSNGKWIHALLHKLEGDNWNSNYWYRQVSIRPFSGSFEAEWEAIARSILEDQISNWPS